MLVIPLCLRRCWRFRKDDDATELDVSLRVVVIHQLLATSIILVGGNCFNFTVTVTIFFFWYVYVTWSYSYDNNFHLLVTMNCFNNYIDVPLSHL